MKNGKIWVFIAALVGASLLCAFSGCYTVDGMLLSGLTAGLLAAVLVLAPAKIPGPVFWILPLAALAVPALLACRFSAIFVGVSVFLPALTLSLCYLKRQKRIVTVSVTAAALGFGILAYLLYCLMVLTDGDISRTGITAQIDRFVRYLTKIITPALPEGTEDPAELIGLLVRTLIAAVPGILCAACFLLSYLSSGLFRLCLQSRDTFARDWHITLSRVTPVVYLVLMVLSYFIGDTTVAFGISNVLTLLQMVLAVFGFHYLRLYFVGRCIGQKNCLGRYYTLVAFLFVVSPVAAIVLPLLSASAGSFASFLMMLPFISYTVFYIAGLIGVFKLTKKTAPNDTKQGD